MSVSAARDRSAYVGLEVGGLWATDTEVESGDLEELDVAEIDHKVVDFIEEFAAPTAAQSGVVHSTMDGQTSRSDVAALRPAVRIEA